MRHHNTTTHPQPVLAHASAAAPAEEAPRAVCRSSRRDAGGTVTWREGFPTDRAAAPSSANIHLSPGHPQGVTTTPWGHHHQSGREKHLGKTTQTPSVPEIT